MFLDSPNQEKKCKSEEDNKYTNSVAPYTALTQRTSHATTPRPINQHFTPVAETAPTSAFDNGAALHQFDEMPAPWAPLPLLLLHQPPESDVVPIPGLRALLAREPRVPNPLTLETEQLLTIGALGFLHNSAALVHDHHVAAQIRAVALLQLHDRRLAEHVAPPHEQSPPHGGGAVERIERVVAANGGALYAADVVLLQLHADVLDHAVSAERVDAFAAVPELPAGIRGRLDADFAGEFAVLVVGFFFLMMLMLLLLKLLLIMMGWWDLGEFLREVSHFYTCLLSSIVMIIDQKTKKGGLIE